MTYLKAVDQILAEFQEGHELNLRGLLHDFNADFIKFCEVTRTGFESSFAFYSVRSLQLVHSISNIGVLLVENKEVSLRDCCSDKVDWFKKPLFSKIVLSQLRFEVKEENDELDLVWFDFDGSFKFIITNFLR